MLRSPLYPHADARSGYGVVFPIDPKPRPIRKPEPEPEPEPEPNPPRDEADQARLRRIHLLNQAERPPQPLPEEQQLEQQSHAEEKPRIATYIYRDEPKLLPKEKRPAEYIYHDQASSAISPCDAQHVHSSDLDVLPR
eukprot:1608545-Rhodomonas_salina.1